MQKDEGKKCRFPKIRLIDTQKQRKQRENVREIKFHASIIVILILMENYPI